MSTQTGASWRRFRFPERSPGPDDTGRAMAALLAVLAAFEREILQERVRAGLAHARQNGKRLGRPATAATKAVEVRALRACWRQQIRDRPQFGDRAHLGGSHSGGKGV